MAARQWRGDQAAFFKTATVTASGTWTTGDTVTLTINTKAVTVTLGSAYALADVVEVLGRAVNGDALKGNETRNTTGSLIGEFAGITATYASAVLTLTADVSGVPFTAASSKTSTSGVIGAVTNVTAPAGPNELAANNVTGASLTASSNTLVFENSSVSCSYGLDQSSAGTWTELDINASFTGDIGLPLTHVASPTSYAEYLDRYLAIRASKVVIGAGSGNGSGRVHLDLGDVQSEVQVRKTGASVDTGLYAAKIKGTSASNTLFVDGGCVDIAPYAGETATFSTVSVSGSGMARMSTGVAVTTIEVMGNADLIIDSLAATADITTLTIRDNATVTVYGTNTITNAFVYGGTLKPLGTFTVTNLKVGSGGKVDTTGSTGTVTCTNTELEAKAKIEDSGSHLVFSNAIDLGLAGLEDVSLRLGKGINVLPS